MPSPRRRSTKINGKQSSASFVDGSKDKASSVASGKKDALSKGKKRNKMHGLASQDQVHKQRRNKLLIGVLLYIAAAAGVLLWKGLTKLPEIPPELESEILGSYPQHLKDIEMPSNMKSIEKRAAADVEGDVDQQNSANVEKKNLPELKLSPILTENGKIFRDWNEIVPSKKLSESSIRVFSMDNFLSPDECDELIKFHNNLLNTYNSELLQICFKNEAVMLSHVDRIHTDWSKKISSIDFLPNTFCLNETLSSKLIGYLPLSYTSNFNSQDSSLTVKIEYILQKYAGISKENNSLFQITSFSEGIGQNLYQKCHENSDNRFATVLVFLLDSEEGGEVEFPDLKIKLPSRKGKAVIWKNIDINGKCEPASYNRVLPIRKGKQYILHKQYYQDRLQSGKKLPYVECDEIDSCRWYGWSPGFASDGS